MIATLFVLFQLLGLVSSVHAILHTRTAQGAIAWVVSLNTISVVAVPLYWVFGRSRFEGYVNALRDCNLVMDEEKNKRLAAFAPWVVEGPEHFPEYRAIRRLSLYPFFSGNRVSLLVDGAATFDSMSAGIDRARDYILFQFYILRADQTGTGFMDRLARKVCEGVKVHVLYDEIGSYDLPRRWLAHYRAQGIEIAPFGTTRGRHNRFQINFRNHRKVLVVDGREAWVGGLNIGDEYLGRHPRLTPWRDTHLHLRGPAALMAQAAFWSDWYWAESVLLGHLHWRPVAAVEDDDRGQDVLVLASGPADDLETASLFFTTVINAARKRIWIATPYFIPDESTRVALALALLRGVEVRILTPRLNDNRLVHNAARVYLSELARLGARVFYYEEGFMHQKVVLLDHSLAMVGTVNFDNRSFRLNFEITGVVADRDFAREVEGMLEQDFTRATELGEFDLARRPFWERFKARACDLLAPVL